MAPTATMLLFWYHHGRPTPYASPSPPPTTSPPPRASDGGGGAASLSPAPASFSVNIITSRGAPSGLLRRPGSAAVKEKPEQLSESSASSPSLEDKFQEAIELSCWSL